MKRVPVYILIIVFAIACGSDDNSLGILDPVDGDGNDPVTSTDSAPCENGMAGEYPCNGFDLIGAIPNTTFSGGRANDIWGWADTTTGKEYAIMGVEDGTVFVDISDNEELLYLGKLPTASVPSRWRDIKVYEDHAFIVSEASGHGMQVFDLTKLRNVTNIPTTFEADARYTGFGNAHNIVINEDTGFAYAVGTTTFNGGAHFVNIQDPKNPVANNGYGDRGYAHDAQVVTYNGPDTDYTGREIFIGANEDQVVIADVTDKDNPITISSLSYSNFVYTHQGWFTEDQRYFIVGDEEDERLAGFNTRTLIFDLTDLDNPILHYTYLADFTAIDHNGYVKGDEFYLANYTAGVRLLDISGIANEIVSEIAFFDTYPAHNNVAYEGVWSVYPYFASGKILVSDIDTGLFVIQKSN